MLLRALLALALLALPASAQVAPTRGELVFRHHANGMQYPHYTANRTQTCATPSSGDQRQRLVDLAAQEWSRFGYPLSQRAHVPSLRQAFPELRRAKPPPYAERDPLMLATIGGYWAALSGVGSGDVADSGGFEIANANALWQQAASEYRANLGWRTPWSAAFISWVMCEGGVSDFRRSWAHRDYVDASIAATQGATHPYRAAEPDHAPNVGDLLCSSRSDYRTNLATRREDPAVEASMHCDLVVAINAPARLILAIGGNVDNAVSLVPYRIIGASGAVRVRTVCPGTKLCEDERLFAVLALQARPSEATLARAPTLTERPPRILPRFAQ